MNVENFYKEPVQKSVSLCCYFNNRFLDQNQLIMIDTIALEPLDIAEIKRLYPDEWVLIGNPVMNETESDVLSGIPVLHSKDKKEIAYFGRAKALDYQTVMVIYTGQFKPVKRIATVFSRPRS